jgi:hypothetical protein
MLRDLITNIVNDQGDIRIVGHLRSDGVSLRDLERTEPDMIIVGLRDSKIPDVCKTLVERHAATKVVGLYGEGRRGILYELKPHAVMLGDHARGFGVVIGPRFTAPFPGSQASGIPGLLRREPLTARRETA